MKERLLESEKNLTGSCIVYYFYNADIIGVVMLILFCFDTEEGVWPSIPTNSKHFFAD